MNVKLAHHHGQTSYEARLLSIGRPPIFLLAQRCRFHTFNLNVTSRDVAAVETCTSHEWSILPTVVVGLVITLATTAEA
jgi:hypothetical protein